MTAKVLDGAEEWANVLGWISVITQHALLMSTRMSQFLALVDLIQIVEDQDSATGTSDAMEFLIAQPQKLIWKLVQ